MQRQQGAVSLFLVIFSALLIITIGSAFISIMIQDQSQATANDLSTSALDSANAGVEDAKRAITEYYKLGCNTPTPGSCVGVNNVLTANTTPDGWTTRCTDIPVYLGETPASDGSGIAVNANNTADNLNQAYTCLKVQMNPPDYVGSLTPGTSRILKLKAKSGDPAQVTIQWYTLQPNQTLNIPDNGTAVAYNLPAVWPKNTPSVMKAQLIQYKGNFTLGQFDSTTSTSPTAPTSSNQSLYLLPSTTAASILTFADDSGGTAGGAPQRVSCTQASGNRYACSASIMLPTVTDPANPGNTASRTAYLKLDELYASNNTDFRVTMQAKDGTPLNFSDVQIAVDSTGRANTLFRRIQSRLDVGVSTVPNPESAVDVTKSLCKEFAVTNTSAYAGSHMRSGGACPILPN